MRFDFTHGKPAKYMVSLYGWNVEDHIYFSEWEAARDCFERKKGNITAGQSLSLVDMANDFQMQYVEG